MPLPFCLSDLSALPLYLTWGLYYEDILECVLQKITEEEVQEAIWVDCAFRR